jgi:quercetin dioxygenase-like cupin family protein
VEHILLTMGSRVVGVLPVLLVLVSAAAVVAQTAPPPGFTIETVLDNATVGVAKLLLAPGAREQPHTHPYPLLIVITSRGDLEITNGGAHKKGPRIPGDIEFVAAGTSHAGANVGALPLHALALALKPSRAHGDPTPQQLVPGVTRTALLDNAEARVTRLEFEEDAREPLHTHPYDVLIVAITPARVDLQLGTKKDVHSYAVGETIYVPRTVPHAIANTGTAAFRILAIAIK